MKFELLFTKIHAMALFNSIPASASTNPLRLCNRLKVKLGHLLNHMQSLQKIAAVPAMGRQQKQINTFIHSVKSAVSIHLIRSVFKTIHISNEGFKSSPGFVTTLYRHFLRFHSLS